MKKETTKKKEISFEAPVYSVTAKKVSTVLLPKEVFGLSWNADLVHQVSVSMMANARLGTAHTKDRGEVSGGGKKPWKQKGTGRARHGSSRSPIWVGGGITHGPRTEKDYGKKINKKMKVKALFTALSKKWSLGKMAFLETLELPEVKTKAAATLLVTLSAIPSFEGITKKKQTALLLVVPTKTEALQKSFSNLPGVTMIETKELNVQHVLTFNSIFFVSPEETVQTISAKMS